MRHRHVALAFAVVTTLGPAGCDSVTPPGLAGSFSATFLRIDTMRLDIEVASGGEVSGVGAVSNDRGSVSFTIHGSYPEVTFTMTTDDPGFGYYDLARFRGTFRSTDHIVGSLTLIRTQQVIPLTFQRQMPSP